MKNDPLSAQCRIYIDGPNGETFQIEDVKDVTVEITNPEEMSLDSSFNYVPTELRQIVNGTITFRATRMIMIAKKVKKRKPAVFKPKKKRKLRK